MLKKKLGNTNELISAIGFGTIGAGSYKNAITENIKKRKDALSLGIEMGINFFDTGENYEDGHAEKILGEIIKGKREHIFISSKFKTY